MKQSDLSFIDNSKTCVFCTWNGNIEFYWESRSSRILVRDMVNSDNCFCDIDIPSDFTAANARREICRWLEASFNV